MRVALVAGLAVAAVLLVAVVRIRNGLVARRQAVAEARAQVDAQLRRRHDLVPGLVRAVQGYLEHERDVLTRVTTARTAALAATGAAPAETAAAENALTAALLSLRDLVERHPRLHGGAVVLRLQEDLTSAENRIAFARQHHADAVMGYNTAREELPASLVAGPLGFRPAAYLELELPGGGRPPAATW
jgi:LemA protein